MLMYALVMPRARHSQADDLARELLLRVARWLLIALGLAIIAAGVVISPLPGPGGIPVIVLGLMLVLRNSFWARKQFIKAQKAHPNWVFPIRRLLRREPEVFPVAWQQVLRVERIVLPSRYRLAVRWRKSRKRKHVMRNFQQPEVG
jgi:predicted membrane chloride channel (bestrophin family)